MGKLWGSRYALSLLLIFAFLPAAALVYLQFRSLSQIQEQMHRAMMGNLQQALIGARVEAENDFYRWPHRALVGAEMHGWLRHRDVERMHDVALGTRRICPQISILFGYLIHPGGEPEIFVFRPGEARRSMDYSPSDAAAGEIRQLVTSLEVTTAHFYSVYADLDGQRQQIFFHLVDDELVEPKEPIHQGLIGYYGFAAPARELATEYFAPLLEKHLARVAGPSNGTLISRAKGGVYDGSGKPLGRSSLESGRFVTIQESIGSQTGMLPGWTLRAGFPYGALHDFDRRQFVKTISLVVVIAALLAGSILVLGIAAAREKELSRAKTEFVAIVSHELKTPLSLIRGFAETLQLNRLGEQSQREEYFGIIQTQILRLSTLIDRILDMSKIEVGIKQYQTETVDVAELIEDTLANFSSELERGSFTLVRRIDPNLPAASVDPNAFSQALLNLLSNAVKYSGAERRIEVSADRLDDRLQISVRDYGVGIPKSEQTRIFDRFYRGRNTAARTSGAGLGLTLVKHFAKAHGGDVVVTSAPGTGSHFAILLPLHT